MKRTIAQPRNGDGPSGPVHPRLSRHPEGRSSTSRIAALAIVAGLAAISAPGIAQTTPTPSGPAAQAIGRWFTTDRSLGCSNQQGNDSACTIGFNAKYGGFSVYYGDSTGGGPQADALAFVYYSQDPSGGGNGSYLAIAYFHRDGGNYRFIKTFPDVVGDQPQITPKVLVKGTTIQFLPGKARFSMVVSRDGDAGCCPTGHADYTLTLDGATGTGR